MTEEEYKRLFEDVKKKEQQGFGVSENHIPREQNPYNNLNETVQNEQWSRLNETPDISQYKIDENVNGGWSNDDFQIESRMNGITQQRNNNPYQQQRRKKPQGQNLNGLDQFVDDDDNLNEVVKQPILNSQIPDTNITESVEDVDVVTLEMFEKMNNNGLISLHQRIFR